MTLQLGRIKLIEFIDSQGNKSLAGKTLTVGSRGLTGLAEDWRKLLFPQADNAQFADGYAQAVTFGLLIARASDISLAKGLEEAAQELKKPTRSLERRSGF